MNNLFCLNLKYQWLIFFLMTAMVSISIHAQADKWIVITTINPPTAIFNSLAQLTDWQIVVVADKKTPKNWNFPGVIFLGIEEQEKLPYKIIKLLPWNHYSRKNIGYLYAIEHGAQIIYETDDDNFLINNAITYLPEKVNCLVSETKESVINPYIHFGQPTVWPRGYPLKEICTPSNNSYLLKNNVSIPIQQGIVNKDPDVDAIFRLTRNEFVNFSDTSPVALSKGTMTPFNSQNTLFYHTAFWGLLMPMTTSFRVADIWRGYWVQRLLWDINASLCFLPATAIQERNEHDFLDDFKLELDLYLKAHQLIKTLNTWNNQSTSFFDRMLDLMATLVKHDFFEAKDLDLAKAWIEDLTLIGYTPPVVQ